MKNNIKAFIFIICSSALLATYASQEKIANHQVSVIFDMNGVLVETASPTKLLGLKLILSHIVFEHYNPFTVKHTLKTKLYGLFNNINPEQVDCAVDEHGHMMPQILCDWQKGFVDSAQLLEQINLEIDTHCTHYQAQLLKAVVHILLSPAELIKTQTWHTNMMNFAQQLKKYGYKIYILSNWDPESFTHMLQAHPQVFALFDGIIISGQVGLLKPSVTIFEYMLQKWQLNPAHCFFVDDQPKNIASAQSVGLTTAHAPHIGWFDKKHDIKKLKKEFAAWRSALIAHS